MMSIDVLLRFGRFTLTFLQRAIIIEAFDKQNATAEAGMGFFEKKTNKADRSCRDRLQGPGSKGGADFQKNISTCLLCRDVLF